MNSLLDAMPEELPVHSWLELQSMPELEGWMELNNQELQKLVIERLGKNQAPNGQGICLFLKHGGEIYVHTNQDGDVLLDVTEEASWVVPVITACTNVQTPRGQIWLLPQHSLLSLLMGLNSLIASSQLVLRHAYRIQKNHAY
jgi:hypothetical protein